MKSSTTKLLILVGVGAAATIGVLWYLGKITLAQQQAQASMRIAQEPVMYQQQPPL